MSTPTRIRHAIDNYFGGHDQEIMREILAALDSHFRSPWIFNQDAQPDAGVEVICLDVNTLDGSVEVSTATRSEGNDWTHWEARFWWMHVPPLPEGGLLRVQESPETRVDAGDNGGHQALPEGGDQSETPFDEIVGHLAILADSYAESEAAVAALRAQCAPHEDIQAAVNVADSDRTALLEHARAILALRNQNTNKEADHVV